MFLKPISIVYNRLWKSLLSGAIFTNHYTVPDTLKWLLIQDDNPTDMFSDTFILNVFIA